MALPFFFFVEEIRAWEHQSYERKKKNNRLRLRLISRTCRTRKITLNALFALSCVREANAIISSEYLPFLLKRRRKKKNSERLYLDVLLSSRRLINHCGIAQFTRSDVAAFWPRGGATDQRSSLFVGLQLTLLKMWTFFFLLNNNFIVTLAVDFL